MMGSFSVPQTKLTKENMEKLEKDEKRYEVKLDKRERSFKSGDSESTWAKEGEIVGGYLSYPDGGERKS